MRESYYYPRKTKARKSWFNNMIKVQDNNNEQVQDS